MAEIVYLTDLVKTLIDEVKILRADNVQLHEKIDLMREEMKPKKRGTPKAPVAPKVQCSAIAASSGNRCKCRAKEGKDVCEKHDKQRQTEATTSSEPRPSVPNKKPRVKKAAVKKVVPVHNHPVGEPPREGVVCELCENHGDIFDPDIADAEFEILPENGQSIEERLRIMLENEGE
jgi:hypothetical protein